jgi:hypothetical protein
MVLKIGSMIVLYCFLAMSILVNGAEKNTGWAGKTLVFLELNSGINTQEQGEQ